MGSFRIGDVVRYKAGSMEMTVTKTGPIAVGGVPIGVTSRGLQTTSSTSRNDLVVCKWFEKGEACTRKYQVAHLELVRGAESHQISEGQLVRLASGGPAMLVLQTGPMEVGGMSMASLRTGLTKIPGSVRNDLAGCEWEHGRERKRARFELATLVPA
ncbi:DUF2158 domain-containing protein [Pseudomonas sp. PDM18]|nr:DUF2158 domain-containing protein [Pseudomonas sp. PDM18]